MKNLLPINDAEKKNVLEKKNIINKINAPNKQNREKTSAEPGGQETVFLNAALLEILQKGGVDHWGFACLEADREAIEEEYGSVWQDYPRAISFAVNMPWAVVEQLLVAPTHTYLYYYDVVNDHINDITLNICRYLESEGYRAFPIPASQRVENRLSGIFSHRWAAVLAGLGWIGKSCNLINPQVGPRLRLGTVLTDAPLETDLPLANGCGECTICLDGCPAKAIKGVPFQKGQGLEHRLDVLACDQHLLNMRHAFGKRICGLCIALCPYGRKREQRKKT
ncbi:MAG: epoxyqueuosine reductase [Clostridiales bacterium]